MDLTNPFGQNVPTRRNEQAAMKKQRQYERDSIVTEQSVAPQNRDDDVWMQRSQELSEIRRWLLDLTDKYQRAFEELSGVRFTDNGDAVEIPYIAPVITIDGAFHLINYIKIFDHNVMRSNYTEQRINLNLRYGVGNPLIAYVKSMARNGSVKKDKAILDYLVNYCFNLIEPVYYHALNDGERRHESDIHKVIETKNVLPDEKKKGLFSR